MAENAYLHLKEKFTWDIVAEKVQTAIYGDSNVINDENSKRAFSHLTLGSDGHYRAR